MKPISLCLVQMGQKGLELVKAYPDVLPENTLNQIIIKSMPMGAQEGDFSSSTANDTVFSGYIFKVPSEVERSNIASLVAVYNDMKYDSESIRKVFAFTISELKKKDLVDIETLSRILPNLYTGLVEGQLKIKISSIVTLEFNFNEGKDANKDDEALNEFGKDLWK
ncbi:MAG TPA: hypothetical protein VMZ29_05995 [Candidatus Bathyarchaeia archaeon]|nr:hypothetical protein [Candidatus Bathyarchaeia archaeon]